MFEDLHFVETPPAMRGCVGGWMDGWVDVWVKIESISFVFFDILTF